MKPYLIFITLLLLIAFALTFALPAYADPRVPVPWEIDCRNGFDGDGFTDRGFCVPGIITSRTHYTRSPSRFWGVGSSYAPGVMEKMCDKNGGCDGYLDGVALMSCGDIGRTAWIKVSEDRPWYGPLKVVDCSQPFHAYVNIAVYGFVIEWGHKTTLAMGVPTGSAVRVHLGERPTDSNWGWYYPNWWIDYALEFTPFIGINWELRFAYRWLCEEKGVCYFL